VRKQVLVAGGSGALGQAVVGELAERGWDVTVVDRREPDNPAQGIRYLAADLFEPGAAAGAVGSVEGLEAVVNLVGGYSHIGKVGDADVAEFEAMLRLNLVPGFNLAHAAMPRFADAGRGAYVGVSARAALEPFSGASGYIAAKAAVLAFVRALDREYGDAGVRCNAVLPSVIDTPANRDASPNADWSKWVPPEEIARVIAFLCSDDAAPTSGAAVPVYGRA
jgi:NAD(P)-dependent dehydrogenase (short-subunit alcohol dehydrogenase family)